ncbi:MAG: hypothetical protein NVV59_10100 [Chitinophagaceae bacterium]|nr:hypothetical protein [Chitinophagaceae bacterium]
MATFSSLRVTFVAMRTIICYLRQYIRELNTTRFLLCSIWIAILVYLNYAHDLEGKIYMWEGLLMPAFTAPAIVYSLAFFRL